MPFLPITEPVMTALRTPHRTINLVIVSSCDRGGCVRALGSSLPHRLPPPRGVYLTLYTCGICLAVPIPILASRRFDKYKTIHRRLRLQVQKIPGSTTTGLRLHPHHRATLSLTWLSTSSLAEPMQPQFLPPSPPALLLRSSRRRPGHSSSPICSPPCSPPQSTPPRRP